jgi:hypothetical protein
MSDTQRDYVAEALGEQPATNGGTSGSTKPLLIIDSGNLPVVAEELRDALARSGALYNRGTPVRITKPSSDAMPIASPLTTHGVVRLAHEHTRPIKDGEPATLPDRVANLYLDMQGEWNVPKLAGISAAPLLSDDGAIRVTVGYDAATGIYCHGAPSVTVPERPTRDQAAAALLTIRAAFRTFPFADAARQDDKTLNVAVVDLDRPTGHDESAFIAALLTAVCRPSLWLAPGVIVNAPSISGAGTGKGLLIRAIGMIAYGMHVRPFTPGNDRHEMDKRLVAEVIEGRPMLAMDNVNATLLRSNTLASLLTERPSGVRILGRSQMVTLEHASFVALTGNGLAVSEDLARRFLYVELDARCEDPEQRPFSPGFLDEIARRRSELLAAALTIWRFGRRGADDADGCCGARGITLGSFEQWGRWVRDPLLALGCLDPVARVRELKERDPERQRVIELFATWWANHGDQPIRVSDLAQEVRDIADPAGRGRQYLARAISNLVGTRQGGFVLERVGEISNRHKAGALYSLRQIVGREATDPSASSALPADSDKTQAKTTGPQERMHADDADASARSTARRCDQCGESGRPGTPVQTISMAGETAQLHRRCEPAWLKARGY